jgi:hypothetical protein
MSILLWKDNCEKVAIDNLKRTKLMETSYAAFSKATPVVIEHVIQSLTVYKLSR